VLKKSRVLRGKKSRKLKLSKKNKINKSLSRHAFGACFDSFSFVVIFALIYLVCSLL